MLDIKTSIRYIAGMATNVLSHSRFARPVFLWALAALVTEVAVSWLPRALHLSVPRSATLLPLIPALFFWVSLLQMIQKMDELQRRIWYESVFLAFMATLALTFAFSALERAGILRAPWGDIGSYMLLLWGSAYVFCAVRYR